MNRIAAWTTGLALAAVTALAGAEDPFTEHKVQASGHAGYGLLVGDGELNPHAFGLGLRGGYTLDPHVYVGGLFDYFFGRSQESILGGNAVSARLWLAQAEGGYDLGLADWIVLRPKIGLGVARLSGQACYPVSAADEVCESSGELRFAASGGAEALVDLGILFVAPEARFTFIDQASGVFVGAGAGAAF
jgi:hypothetical protein